MTVVGVDLGGTKIAAARVDGAGRTGEVVRVPTPAQDGPAAVLDAVANLVRRVSGGPLRAVGVGTAGIVDPVAGTILSATETLPGWRGTEVAAGLRARLDLAADVPVAVRNDVDAHALGEDWVGAAREASSALVVAVGTGVGGSWILDGRLWTGARHTAGEVGHMPVPGAEGLVCPCGRPGHLEAIGSGTGLLAHFRALGGEESVPSAREVVARAPEDPLAARALTDAAEAVGRAVAGLVTAVGPHVVVMTGGLASAGLRWWEPFERALRAELVDVLTDIPVVAATLGESAAIVGAARAAREELEA